MSLAETSSQAVCLLWLFSALSVIDLGRPNQPKFGMRFWLVVLLLATAVLLVLIFSREWIVCQNDWNWILNASSSFMKWSCPPPREWAPSLKKLIEKATALTFSSKKQAKIRLPKISRPHALFTDQFNVQLSCVQNWIKKRNEKNKRKNKHQLPRFKIQKTTK